MTDYEIRHFNTGDLDQVAEIWLAANQQAHSFISAEYWLENLGPVKEMLPQAEIYVLEREGEIAAFIGLQGDYIAGLFVSAEVRSRGLGRLLLDRAKQEHDRLSLKVYSKNTRAQSFYLREGFVYGEASIDSETGEEEHSMFWERG